MLSTEQMEWQLRVAGGSAASLVRPVDHPDVVRIAITAAHGGNAFDVQANLGPLQIDTTGSYVLRFKGRADRPRPMFVGVAQAREPWAGLGLYAQVELSEEWREFCHPFTATGTDDMARVHFDLGATGTSVEFSGVSVQPQGESLTGDRTSRAAPKLDLGAFRRLTPISQRWGFDRGLPIDRYYVEAFLARHASDIRGRVLEIEDDVYTRRFGGDAVSIRDVLHVASGNPRATILADLTNADHIPSDLFDCAVITQTLQFIYDVRAAIGTLHRILKPGGVLLVTVPGLTRISHEEWRGSWFWRFTAASVLRLIGDVFGPNVEIQAYGNVLTASAFLYGLATQDLERTELDHLDPDFEVIVAVRAVKSRASV